MNLICKIFGHEKMILWCQEEGWKCLRCGEKHITRIKPESEYPRAIKPKKYPRTTYPKTTQTSTNSYSPYIVQEIDNIIEKFKAKFSPDNNAEYQTTLNIKLIYIIRDLLIRIEKLESLNT